MVSEASYLRHMRLEQEEQNWGTCECNIPHTPFMDGTFRAAMRACPFHP